MSEFVERGHVAEFLASVEHEDEHFEAKAAANNIPDNAWETVSAFANTDGGVILFGVSERPEGFVATGVADPERLRQRLQTELRTGARSVTRCRRTTISGLSR
jgi:ATP-dependent DNA helicase RecG